MYKKSENEGCSRKVEQTAKAVDKASQASIPGEKKTLPDSAFDFLVELWARSHDCEVVSIETVTNH